MTKGDEATDDDLYDEDDDDDLENMFVEPAGDGDEMWEIDWSPDQGLIPVGEHDAVLADVKKGETSGFGGKPKKPAIIWAVTVVGSARTLTKAVPMDDGSGISRISKECCLAFGVEPKEGPNGNLQIPAKEIRSHIGDACRVRVTHWTDSNDNLRESLDMILAAN